MQLYCSVWYNYVLQAQNTIVLPLKTPKNGGLFAQVKSKKLFQSDNIAQRAIGR